MSTQLLEQEQKNGTGKPRLIHIEARPSVALCGAKIKKDSAAHSGEPEQCMVCYNLATHGRFSFR